MKTADVCDANEGSVRVVEPSAQAAFRQFGGARALDGRIATVRVNDENASVRAMLGEPGEGRVLVVDGGGSRRCALLGDNLAALAKSNGWSGVIVNGCVRDAAALASIEVGVVALGTHPKRSAKRGDGAREVPVTFGGVTFVPGQWVCADDDGIVVLDHPPEDPRKAAG